MPVQPSPSTSNSRRTWSQRLFSWAACLGAILLACPGCIHPHIMTKRNYDFYNSMSITYGNANQDGVLEKVPYYTPRTVVDPTSKQKWNLSLEEAKRLALTHNPTIMAAATTPGQFGSDVDRQLSEFDAFWGLGGGWQRQDQPLTSTVANIGSGQNSLRTDSFGSSSIASNFGGPRNTPLGVNTTNGAATQEALGAAPPQHFFELIKKNATGGTTRLNYDIGYSFQNSVGIFTTVNPAWTSEVSVGVAQPFLQGAGVEFNRARILVARANFEQSIKSFEQSVQAILQQVESAYWELCFAYYDLYSREVGLEQGLATWQQLEAEFNSGKSTRADVAQTREQLEFFRAQRIQALGRLLERERALRILVGLPPEDDRQIVPADEPSTADYTPDWETGTLEAVSLRPEIVGQEFAIRASELELLRQQNGLMADLTGTAEASLIGLDNTLDGSIDNMTDGDNETWSLGLRYMRQIGERAAHARVRQQQLTLDRERKELQNLRHTALHELTDAYRNIITNYQLIKVNGDRRRAAAVQVTTSAEQYRFGTIRLVQYIEAQTALADAIRDEGRALVQYNQSLIQWELAKGTILQHDSIVVADGSSGTANRKLLQDRRRQWEASLPLPIWGGSKVHMDHTPNLAPEGPLYPDVIGSAGEIKPNNDLPSEEQPVPTTDVELNPPPTEAAPEK